MPEILKKEDAYKLIEQLPAEATWEDLMYKIYVRESIESGLKDSKADNVKSVTDIRKKFGLSE
jgi:hypothetical protein